MIRRAWCVAATVLGAITVVSLDDGPITPVRAQSADPCATTLIAGASSDRAALRAANPSKTSPMDHDPRWGHLDSLWAHRAAVAHSLVTAAPIERQSQDVGEIAVLQDGGDLIMKPNPFDLGDLALLFTPNANGGFSVTQRAFGFRQPFGNSVTLADDDTHEVALPFAFPFFGQRHDRFFLNSDGNVTFNQSDTASTERSVSRFLTGPPRIAPFFADLDPSAGGRVLTSESAGAFSVTWCGVRAFDKPEIATVQMTLLANGPIEFQVSSRTTIRDAVVGVSPGDTTAFTPVDLTTRGAIPGGSSAVGEVFTSTSELDTVAVVRRFLGSHADEFDNVFIFTDTRVIQDAFAYEFSISNGIRGLNIPAFDYSSEFGTAGRLQSLINMDALSKYPDDPRQKFHGENSTLTILGQEFGHRWLAFLQFRDHTGAKSDALLGRENAHWSFFFDSDGSVVEGNDIVDLGGGAFRTAGAVQRYSLLDQYAMGLVDQTQVPPFFYVEDPTNVSPARTAASAPQVGVTFNGTRRNVTIDDVIAVAGRRSPTSVESPRVYRQAFIYIMSAGREADPREMTKLDRIRVAWDQFLSAATDSRMRVETRLSF